MTFPVYLIFSSADSFLLAYDHAQIYFILKQTIKNKPSLALDDSLSIALVSFSFYS